MASSSFMLCIGFGQDIANVKGNRLLQTDTSRASLMEEEYRARGKSDVH